MPTQGCTTCPPNPRHPNARLIENLYAAIAKADPAAITACYAEDAYFEDIAFRLHGRERIRNMWEMICDAKPKVAVTFDPNSIAADDRKGRGKWNAIYWYGRTDTKPGRKVDNTLNSAFAFRDGLIVEHRDRCDAMAWARQALPLPDQPRRRLGRAAAALHGRAEAQGIPRKKEAVTAAACG